MFSWLNSVTVTVGSLVAALGVAVQSPDVAAIIPPNYAAGIMAAASIATVLARFRDGAGASITASQKAKPN